MNRVHCLRKCDFMYYPAKTLLPCSSYQISAMIARHRSNPKRGTRRRLDSWTWPVLRTVLWMFPSWFRDIPGMFNWPICVETPFSIPKQGVKNWNCLMADRFIPSSSHGWWKQLTSHESLVPIQILLETAIKVSSISDRYLDWIYPWITNPPLNSLTRFFPEETSLPTLSSGGLCWRDHIS